MSSMRKRQALYGYAPNSNPLTQTTTCPDPISGRKVYHSCRSHLQ